MKKTNWIKVTDKLPNHMDQVIVLTKKKNQFICEFLENQKVEKFLAKRGVEHAIAKNAYAFCSREIPGNELQNVTHWHPLLPLPK